MTSEFRDAIDQRLCPDIADNDLFYKVRNAYSN